MNAAVMAAASSEVSAASSSDPALAPSSPLGRTAISVGTPLIDRGGDLNGWLGVFHSLFSPTRTSSNEPPAFDISDWTAGKARMQSGHQGSPCSLRFVEKTTKWGD